MWLNHHSLAARPCRQAGKINGSRNGGLEGLSDLSGHQFVLPSQIDTRVPIWAWISKQIGAPNIAVETTDTIAAREAVFAGLGLGILTEFDVANRSDLTPVLPRNHDWDVPLWLVTHVDLHRTKKVQEMVARIKALRG